MRQACYRGPGARHEPGPDRRRRGFARGRSHRRSRRSTPRSRRRSRCTTLATIDRTLHADMTLDSRRRPRRHPRGPSAGGAREEDPVRNPGRGSGHADGARVGRHGGRDGAALDQGHEGGRRLRPAPLVQRHLCAHAAGLEVFLRSGVAARCRTRRRSTSAASRAPTPCGARRRRCRSSTPSSTAETTKVRCRITYHMILSFSVFSASHEDAQQVDRRDRDDRGRDLQLQSPGVELGKPGRRVGAGVAVDARDEVLVA